MRILLVEDDEPISEMIQQGLESAGYRVDAAFDGPEGLNKAVERDYSAIVLDLMLPGMDGSEVCRELRARKCTVPILMLTARDTVEDRVRGLEMGADDYLPKPFDFSELLARIRSLLRRDAIHRTRIVQVSDLVIDSGLRKVHRGGREIQLTPREYLLLEALVVREGTIVTRDYIQKNVWMDDEAYSNTVDVCIGQLRKKVDSSFPVKLIHTAYGLGYSLRAPEAPL